MQKQRHKASFLEELHLIVHPFCSSMSCMLKFKLESLPQKNDLLIILGLT